MDAGRQFAGWIGLRVGLAGILAGGGVGWPQAAPAFEVASIRPDHSVTGNSSTYTSAGRLTMESVSLKRLIEMGYDVRDFSLAGPGWMETVDFDIVARPLAGTAPTQIPAMLQTLLIERFQLAVHREKKTVSGYGLVVAKKGPTPAIAGAPADGPGGTSSGRGRIESKMVTMAIFADQLARQLNQPVQDLTELAGAYNLKVEWTPDDTPVETAADRPAGPTLFTALQEQLGLRLQPQKVTIDVLVVDHVEKTASEN